MTPLQRVALSLQIASKDKDYGITSDFSVSHRSDKLAPETACSLVMRKVVDELVLSKSTVSVRDCIQLKKAIQVYAKINTIVDTLQTRVITLIQLLTLRILGYSKDYNLTINFELSDDSKEQMTENQRNNKIFDLTIAYSALPHLNLGTEPLPENPFSYLLPSLMKKEVDTSSVIDWRVAQVIQLANIKWSFEKALGSSQKFSSKELETSASMIMEIMSLEINYLYGLEEIITKLDEAFILINKHRTELNSKLFHTTGREKRIAVFPQPNSSSMEELSLQLQTLFAIKHIVAKGFSTSVIKPLLYKIQLFKGASPESVESGNMLIDFITINELLFRVFSCNELIVKRTKTLLKELSQLSTSSTESASCSIRLQFYLAIADLVDKSLMKLTDSSSTIAPLTIDCTQLFQSIHSTFKNVTALSTDTFERSLFDKVCEISKKDFKDKKEFPRHNLYVNTKTKNYRYFLNSLDNPSPLTETSTALMETILETHIPRPKPKLFIDVPSINKKGKKAIKVKRKPKFAAPVKPVTVTDPIQEPIKSARRAIKNISLEEKSKMAPKKMILSPTSVVAIPKTASPFEYDNRVTRWFIHKPGSANDPIIADAAYSTADLTEDEIIYKRFQHNFPIEVDQFAYKYGIMSTGTDRLKKLGVEIQYQIPSEVTIRLSCGTKTERGIFNYSIRKKCFHRHFTPLENERINREFTENGFWQIDYPGTPIDILPTETGSTALVQTQFDGSYIKYQNKNIVIIEDPKNSATITLALPKI